LTGDFHMPRVAIGLSAMVALLLVTAAVTLPTQVLAFDTDNTAPDAITPTTPPAQDPDEKLQLTAPNDPLQLKTDDGSEGTTSGTTTLQLGGATLQISGGTGPALGLQSGTPMGPTIDTTNPADNQKLIPSP